MLEASEMPLLMVLPKWHVLYMILPVKERAIHDLFSGDWKMLSKLQKAHRGPVT